MAVGEEALDIILRLQGVGPYVAGMGEASGATDKFAASSKRAGLASNESAAASEKQSGAAALVSKGMKVVGLAAIAMAAGSVAAAIKWEDMGKTISQQTGLTGKSLEGMMSVIERTAKKAPYSIQEIADAAVLLKLKFGQTDKQVEQTSAKMVAFAKQAGGTAKSVGTQMLSILQDFREPMGNLAPMMDELVAVSQATHKPLGDMLGVVEKFGPKFQTMGMGLQETIKLLGVFQESGIATTMMGRGLTTAITKAGKQHEKSGGSVPDIIKEHMQEIVKAISMEEAKFKASSFFGGNVGPSLAQALFGNTAAFQKVEEAMRKTGGATQLLEAQQKSMGGMWQNLKNNVELTAAKIGQQLIPALKDTFELTEKMIEGIIVLTDKGKLLGPIIFGVAAAFIAYKVAVALAAAAQVAMAIGSFIALWGPFILSIRSAADAMWVFDAAMDANPVGLTVLAVAALVAGIVLLILHFKEVVSFLRGPWGTALILLVLPFVAFPLLVALHFKKAMSVFSEMIGWIKSVWSKLGSILSHPFEYLWGKVSWVFKQIKKAIGDIANVPSSVLKSITGGVNSLNIPGMPSLAAGGTMSHGGFAMINENQQGEVVYLPGGSSVQPSPASSMLQPRAHTPNPAPVEGTTPVQIEAYLELPRSAGRGLYKLITQSVAVKTARS